MGHLCYGRAWHRVATRAQARGAEVRRVTARGWREPGLQGDSIDLFELLKPELLLLAPWLGGSALLAFALGIAGGCAWRIFINRKTSWWWILGVSVLLAVGGLAVAIVLLLQAFR